MLVNLVKSIVHNAGVSMVGFGVAFLGRLADERLGIHQLASSPAKTSGGFLLAFGFVVRAWATVCFYDRQMRVVSLQPQSTLITAGPYRHSRNPLYLGGNVFIFFGAALLLGSPTALLAIAAHLPFVDRFIRREERQLAKEFGAAWQSYARRTPRWI